MEYRCVKKPRETHEPYKMARRRSVPSLSHDLTEEQVENMHFEVTASFVALLSLSGALGTPYLTFYQCSRVP